MWETMPCHCKTELVWDGARLASESSGCGDPIHIGETDGRRPEQLLALAADGSLMLTFLQLADRNRLEVLGYMSNARVSRDQASELELVLAPCILIGNQAALSVASRLLDRALGESAVCRALRGVLRVKPEFVQTAATGKH
jgi:organic hydroperoxide reductase OsmC/OhrA